MLLRCVLFLLLVTSKVIANSNDEQIEIIVYNATEMLIKLENLSTADNYEINPSQFKRINLSSDIEAENNNYLIKLTYVNGDETFCLNSCKDIHINKSSLIQVFTTNSGTEYMITSYDKYGDKYATVS